jgi:phosphoribosyl-AMP cyclohydrolase
MENYYMTDLSVEEILTLSPNYNADKLIAAIAQDYKTREILMLAWMNEDALQKTIETGEAHYWSRSRQSLWHKGATSGGIQKVLEIKIDCDQDAVILLVEQAGNGACHTGRKSCFYRKIQKDSHGRITLVFETETTNSLK